MKPPTRRYQALPRYWTCRECTARGRGNEEAARAHTLRTWHETRHVQAAVIIFRHLPGEASLIREQDS